MKRKIITTADGSTTIQIMDWDEQYHSKHGAIQEAYHVFLKNGLFALDQKQVAILEIGFGTGLNALITYLEAQKQNLTINYVGVEAYPVATEELEQLNYVAELGEPSLAAVFKKMHQVSWEQPHGISSFFNLEKQQKDFFDINGTALFNLIYFDAFGARVQPELWTNKLLQKMYAILKPKGVLVTYCAKGSVRRSLQEVGFTVERLPGPPGKREMLRATKL